jgi:integrase
MAIEKLSSHKLKSLLSKKRWGRHGDGGGLYLDIHPVGKKGTAGASWIYRFMMDGRRSREMGLGPFPDISLAEARDLAQECRRQKLKGIDPLDARNAARDAKRAEAAKKIKFKDCAQKYFDANRAGWRNPKHAVQWMASLETYAYPVIGDLPVGEIDTGHITKILEPIWATKTQTASRVRGRIESVLSYATTHGWRQGPNPATWRGHLANVLPKPSRVAKVEHHPALPWKEIGGFVAELRRQGGMAADALELAILCASRAGEVVGAKPEEFDLNERVWIVPPGRTKAHREHRVPLSEPALAIVRRWAAACGDHLFPGNRKGTHLNTRAFFELLRALGRADLTTHGFRSTFRDWSAETGRPADIAEAALAHTLGDKTVAAYQRGDLLERRRKLMDDWAKFCETSKPGAVIPLPEMAAARSS